MTDTITEARELLETDALVTAAEYKRVIRELLAKIEEAQRTFYEIARL
jgi:hypothetical protein